MRHNFFTWLVILHVVFVTTYAFAEPSSGTQCKGYRMDLKGQKVEMGVIYKEHVILEKVKKSGGVQGRWKLVNYVQEIIYPADIPFQVTVPRTRMDLKLGFWIDVVGAVQGNTVINTLVDNNVVVDVVGKRIGYPPTGVWCGKISGDQVTFKWDETNNLLPLLTGRVVLEGSKAIDLNITSPSEDERLLFSDDSTGELSFTATATTNLSEYKDQIVWEMEKIEGSELTMNPSDGKGPQVEIKFTKLPEDNSQFGSKKLTARLDVDGCEATATRTVKIFYPATAKNNPGKQYPNWFYYWKQTPAARPMGQLISLEWGGRTVDYCTYCGCPMIYKPLYKGGSGHKMITVCDLATICTHVGSVKKTTPFTYEFPLLRREKVGGQTVGKFDGWRKVKYIDLFASGLIHEFQHLNFDMNWRAGKSVSTILAEDGDGDGIPNHLEADYGFDNTKKQTFFANHPVLKALEYDEEWLAYESQYGYQNGTYDRYDWAKPGKQWPTP